MTGPAVSLTRPTAALAASYLAGHAELLAEAGPGALDPVAAAGGVEPYIALLHAWSLGRQLQASWVPFTEWWIVADGLWSGRISFRHHLSESLERYGGHIGYIIRPAHRGRGITTAALALLLDQLRAAGPPRVLITCDTTNPASRRVIEKNGGVLQDVSLVAGRTVPTMRWWIDLRRV
jgi:predicted acetyltransferase